MFCFFALMSELDLDLYIGNIFDRNRSTSMFTAAFAAVAAADASVASVTAAAATTATAAVAAVFDD